MDREKAEKLLAALIFDDLDAKSKAEVLAYLQQDDELRERLADMRMACKVTSDAVQNGPAPVLDQKRQQRLARLAQKGRGRSSIVVFRRLGAIAALLIVGISAVYLGLLPRVAQMRSLSMSATVDRDVDMAYVESQEFLDGIADVGRSGLPRPVVGGQVEDALALNDADLPLQRVLPFNKALSEDAIAPAPARLQRRGGSQPALPAEADTSSRSAGPVSSLDRPAPMSVTPPAPTTAPVATDVKADAARSSHYWAIQPTQDHGVEVLGQVLDTDAYDFKVEAPAPTDGRNRRESDAAYTGLAAGLRKEVRRNTELTLPHATAGGGESGAPSTGQPVGPRPALQPRTSGSASSLAWSDSSTPSDDPQVPALGDLPVTRQLTGENDLADKESVQPSMPGTYGWRGGRRGGMGPEGGMGMMGGMGGAGHDSEPALRGRERMGETLARSKTLSPERKDTGVTGYGVSADPQSGADPLRRNLSEVSEKQGIADFAFQPVEAFNSRTEGLAPTSGKPAMPSISLVEPGLVLRGQSEAPIAAESEVLSAPVATATPQPIEPAAETDRFHDVSEEGHIEEAAASFNGYAIDERIQEDTAPADGVSQSGSLGRQVTDWQRHLGLTQEALTEESKAKRRPDTALSSVAAAGIVPSSQGVQEPSALPDEDGFDLPPASRFKSVPVNPWVLTDRDHLSTFALDVDTASYTLCRRYINQGFLPPVGAVRMEEFINAFEYNYPQRDKPTFAVYVQAAPSPFAQPGQDLVLLKIGVKARTVGRDRQRPAHLVLIVDASASMGQADRLPLVQHGLKLMVQKLSPADRVTLVTCAQEARLHLEGVSAQDPDRIHRAIDAIQAAGTTNLLAGLQLGYATARRLFVPGQVNHVVLCSDGVANVGQTEAEAVLQAVETDRKQGITITSVGVGFGTYNDVLLEALANHGDGSYVFLDSKQQAQRVFVDQLTATLQGVAKDARIQVDFNTQRVRRYRLIGYENRDIEDKRFRDDTVDAGEVGSGQCATALYELEFTGNPTEALGTVFVRYRDIDTNQIQEIARPLDSAVLEAYTVAQAPRFFLAAGVARFAEWLRQSEHVPQTELPRIAGLLDEVSRALPLDRDVNALAELAHRAEHLPQAP